MWVFLYLVEKHVKDELNVNNNLIVENDISLNNDLYVGGDTSLNGTLFVIGNDPSYAALYVDATSAIKLPSGISDARPNPTTGMIRYNTELSQLGRYGETAWQGLGCSKYISETTKNNSRRK